MRRKNNLSEEEERKMLDALFGRNVPVRQETVLKPERGQKPSPTPYQPGASAASNAGLHWTNTRKRSCIRRGLTTESPCSSAGRSVTARTALSGCSGTTA